MEKMRLPIPGGRHYVMPTAVGQRAGIKGLDVPRGHIHIDDKRGTAWVNDDDWLALPVVLAGGDGCISVISNEVPKLMRKLVAFALLGESHAARDLQAAEVRDEDAGRLAVRLYPRGLMAARPRSRRSLILRFERHLVAW